MAFCLSWSGIGTWDNVWLVSLRLPSKRANSIRFSRLCLWQFGLLGGFHIHLNLFHEGYNFPPQGLHTSTGCVCMIFCRVFLRGVQNIVLSSGGALLGLHHVARFYFASIWRMAPPMFQIYQWWRQWKWCWGLEALSHNITSRECFTWASKSF